MRILIVEDNPVLAEGTSKVLRKEGYVVDHVADGLDADAAIAANNFDLIVLDLSLPGMDGLEVLRSMRARGDQAAVIILTARGDLDDRIKGLDYGADDYLIKPFEVRELEARIRVLLRRQAGLRASKVSYGPLNLNLNTLELTAQNGELVDLPNRELRILHAMMLGGSRVVSKSHLVDSLTGFDAEISENAVEQYMSRLRRKLAPFGVGIRMARGIGYYLHRIDE